MVWYFFLEAAQSNWNRKKKGDENRGVTEEGHRQIGHAISQVTKHSPTPSAEAF